MPGVLLRRLHEDTREESHRRQRWGLGRRNYNPRNLKRCQQPPEARRAKAGFPLELQREHGPASNVTSDFGVQDCERIDSCCFKSLFVIVTAALGNEYSVLCICVCVF